MVSVNQTVVNNCSNVQFGNNYTIKGSVNIQNLLEKHGRKFSNAKPDLSSTTKNAHCEDIVSHEGIEFIIMDIHLFCGISTFR